MKRFVRRLLLWGFLWMLIISNFRTDSENTGVPGWDAVKAAQESGGDVQGEAEPGDGSAAGPMGEIAGENVLDTKEDRDIREDSGEPAPETGNVGDTFSEDTFLGNTFLGDASSGDAFPGETPEMNPSEIASDQNGGKEEKTNAENFAVAEKDNSGTFRFYLENASVEAADYDDRHTIPTDWTRTEGNPVIYYTPDFVGNGGNFGVKFTVTPKEGCLITSAYYKNHASDIVGSITSYNGTALFRYSLAAHQDVDHYVTAYKPELKVSIVQGGDDEVDVGSTVPLKVTVIPDANLQKIGFDQELDGGSVTVVINGRPYYLGDMVKDTGNHWTGTLNYTVLKEDVSGNSVTAMVTASVTYSGTVAVTNNGKDVGSFTTSATVVSTGSTEIKLRRGSLLVEKTVNLFNPQLGDTVAYTIAVTNNGGLDLHGVTLKDVMEGDIALSGIYEAGKAGDLLKGQTVEYTVTFVVTEEIIQKYGGEEIANSVTVTGYTESGRKIEETSRAVVFIPKAKASLDVTETADKADGAGLGEEIAFTATVTNKGNMTVENVIVTDRLTGLKKSLGTLLPGASAEAVTAGYTVTEEDILAGSVKNTASAIGTGPDGNEVSGSDSVSVTTEPVSPKLTVVKRIKGFSNTFGLGDTVIFAIHIENEGNVTIRNITVTDELANMTDAEIDGVLAPGQGRIVEAAYTLQEKDILAKKVINVAAVKGIAPDGSQVVSTGAVMAATQDPSPRLTVAKTVVSVPENGTSYELGDKIIYSIRVANDGNVTVKNITVSDPLTGLTRTVQSLAPGACADSIITTYTVKEADILAGKIENTATAAGTALEDNRKVTAAGRATVICAEKRSRIRIAKLATSAPANGAAYALGETVRYSVTVRNDGNLTVTDITITDDLTKESWTVESLAPGEEKTFTTKYTVTEVDILAGSVVNVATAAGISPDPGQPLTPVASCSEEIFTEPGTPGEPGTPSTPGESGEQGTPTEPGTPGEPDTPTEPGTPGEPDTPTEPGTPGEPGAPEEPDTPTEPSTPEKPGTPTESGTPGEPGTPMEPGTPTEPGTPEKPGTPTEPGTSAAEVPDESFEMGGGTVFEAPEPGDTGNTKEEEDNTVFAPGADKGSDPAGNGTWNIEEEQASLASMDSDEYCCILHLLIMVCALLVALYYTHSRKLHQERIHKLRTEKEFYHISRK